ncbi:DedA family protein [Micromonospora chaiyaphumensis]|uniref:Membrane protein DedA, SNARE-associated domain n=1 Tax=Micromonospora chaiyaphumensis TaxID=307119 RepID=A0A1C4TWZ9_9ACTN|nr:VTT domain-containing protein [Micromonospora chaiyaphumensis]SCE63927.1 membrane protein DedA, SNARE-associated domain [Micromonospora chaiyaphumensis]
MTATLGALGSLLLVVLFGSVVPVVPTGAAVSGAAALAAHQHPVTVVLVVLAGALGAYVGDLATFRLLGWGGGSMARRVPGLRGGQRIDRVPARVREARVSTLLVSRLIPGGRIPVLLAAAVAGLAWRRFAVANAPASLLWSVLYAAIGVLGRAVFPEPWESVVAAILLVVVVTQALGWLSRRREAREDPLATR